MAKLTRKRIKKVLQNHYGDTGDRKLVEFNCGGDNWDCIFFVLSGSPPKGYAIYQKGHAALWLYDAWGKRFKKYSNEDLLKVDY